MFCSINFNSVKNTTELFINSVFPSLFPFILFTEIVLKSDILNDISKHLSFLPRIFKLSKNSILPIILGFLCGFPAGSKAIDSLYSSGEISERDANILMSFVNNCSPIFILTTVGVTMFGNIHIGILLLISHIFSSILFGYIYSRFYTHTIIHENTKFLKYSSKTLNQNVKKINTLDINITKFELLQKSILNSLKTLALILGFMIIFNMVADIVIVFFNTFSSNKTISGFLTGIFEVTRGTKNLSYAQNNIPIISFLLGFSGLSIIFQIKSSLKTFKISFKKLIFFKLIHGIFSAIIAYILLTYTNIANITSTVFSNIDYFSYYKFNVYNAYLQCAILIIFVLSTYILISNCKTKK